MLDYRRNRLDYGEMLVPPPGYRLERAVAATYSANLDTLLSIPVALVYAQTLEGKIDGERFQVLEGIRAVSKKLSIYHQKGQIHVPRKFNRLYAFLEDMLIPIRPATHHTTFHPKVWVLRYGAIEEDDYDRFRFVVLSRNLTFDRSWDVAICGDGVLTDTVQSRNAPMVDFLEYLVEQAPFPEAKGFLEDLACAEFSAPDGFKSMRFHPIGIPKYYTNPVETEAADRAVVISPFLDANAVITLNRNVTQGIHLFSRTYELSKLKSGILEKCASCYNISDWVVDGERQLETEGQSDEVQEQDLHAKTYVFDSGGRSRWFIGSANATSAAMHRNTEFMVELVGRSTSQGLDALMRELIGAEEELGVFARFSPDSADGEDPDAEFSDVFRKLQHDLLGIDVKGMVTLSQNQMNFDLRLQADLSDVSYHSKVNLSLAPLGMGSPSRIELGSKVDVVFENIKQTELSRFVVFSVTTAGAEERRFMVKAAIEGMPETRFGAIFKSIVNSPEKFFQYLTFLLAEEHSKEELVGEVKDSGGTGPLDVPWHAGFPIFEALLVTASRSPSKLKHIDSLIDRLRRDVEDDGVVVPPEFLDFWDVWRTLIPAPSGKGDRE